MDSWLINVSIPSLTLFLFYLLLKMLTIIWKWEGEYSEEMSTRKADKQTIIACRVMVMNAIPDQCVTPHVGQQWLRTGGSVK